MAGTRSRGSSQSMARGENLPFDSKHHPEIIQLKYSPFPNYRIVSYCTIIILLPISYHLLGTHNWDIGLDVCCGLPIPVLILNAVHFMGKSRWELENDLSNEHSKSRIALNLILLFVYLPMFLGLLYMTYWA